MGSTFSENEIKFYNDNGELCCFECGSTEEIQMHHIVPKSRGGEKMISICYCCHQKAHHKKSKSVKHSQLISEGIAKSRAAGMEWRSITREESKMGRKVYAEKTKVKRAELCPIIDQIKNEGYSWNEVAEILNKKEILTPQGHKWSKQSAWKIHKKWLKDQKSS